MEPIEWALLVVGYLWAGIYAAMFARVMWGADPLAWFIFWPILILVRAVRGLWNELKGD